MGTVNASCDIMNGMKPDLNIIGGVFLQQAAFYRKTSPIHFGRLLCGKRRMKTYAGDDT